MFLLWTNKEVIQSENALRDECVFLTTITQNKLNNVFAFPHANMSPGVSTEAWVLPWRSV